ncbi:MAG TPA: hypothetical protein VFT78_10600, partial [Hanamia sp.]|nr:hypothetical protein [Hanamia sp.]
MKTSTNFLSKTLIFTFVIFAFSCSSHRKTQPLKITILLDQSYQYDLLNGVYSVFYTNKAPTVIKF